ncbi:MAG: hypothetical protein ACRES0_31940 [Pseudomonas sp.]
MDREALKNELTPVLAKTSTAKLVVIDLDISPATPKQDTRDLDVLLDSPTGPPVVLVVPAFQGTPALTQRQSKWMKERCEADRQGRPLYFAFPYLSGEGGVILRYSEHYPSLGNVARWAAHREFPKGSSLLPASCKVAMHPDAICEFHKGAQDLDLLREHFKLIRELCGTSPIDFESVAPGRLVHRPLETAPVDLAQYLTNNVVFVGGTYDSRDVHLTGAGPMDGVYVHAAIYSSKVTTLPHLYAFLIEITLGVALGFGFNWLFSAATNADHSYQNRLYHQAVGAAMVAWAHWLFIVAVIFLLMIVATVALIYASSSVLWRGSWLNPVPLVIGMLIDGFVASRTVSAVHYHTTAHFPGKVWWVKNASSLVSAALITITLAYISFGAPHGH